MNRHDYVELLIAGRECSLRLTLAAAAVPIIIIIIMMDVVRLLVLFCAFQSAHSCGDITHIEIGQ